MTMDGESLGMIGTGTAPSTISINLKKGSNVYLEGALESREYEANGTKRQVTEVVLQNYEGVLKLIDPRERGEESAAPKKFPGRDSHNEAKRSGYQPDIDLDDSIPFEFEWRG